MNGQFGQNISKSIEFNGLCNELLDTLQIDSESFAITFRQLNCSKLCWQLDLICNASMFMFKTSCKNARPVAKNSGIESIELLISLVHLNYMLDKAILAHPVSLRA